MHSDGLTISSFQYNPTAAKSAWVRNLFGDGAIFHLKPKDVSVTEFFLASREDRAMSAEEESASKEVMRNVFHLPLVAWEAPCSIEMLGFVRTTMRSPSPFKRSNLHVPFVGNATASIPGVGKWRCYYRPLVENWRHVSTSLEPHFVAVVLYCAPLSADSCTAFDREYVRSATELRMSLELQCQRQPGPHRKTRVLATSVSAIPQQAGGRATSHQLGACVAMPYTTAFKEKVGVNNEILSEFVRYYKKLGIMLFLYDRDGQHEKMLSGRFGVSPSEYVYKNYTMMGLLDRRAGAGLRYDNTELRDDGTDAHHRWRYQGNDKVMTLTQCRFEAKALHGIEDVLVIDFDEFLYCSVAEPTASAQRAFIKGLVVRLKAQRFNQVTFPQRLTANTTSSVIGCMMSRVAKGQSVLGCVAPFQYYAGGHSIKSLHLGHDCPLTDYHQACPVKAPRSHNCACKSKEIKPNPWRKFENGVEDRECALVHLSSQDKVYLTEKNALNYRESFVGLDSEIAQVIKS